MSLRRSAIPHISRLLAERESCPQSQRTSAVTSQAFSSCPGAAQRPRSAVRPNEKPSQQRRPESSPGQALRRSARPFPHESIDGANSVGAGAGADKRWRVFMTVGLGSACFMGVYVFFVATSWTNEIKKHAEEKGVLPQNADVSDRWRQLGRNYDDEVELAEKCFNMNIKGKRKQLVSHAYGKVLEVSAGTGRNFAYYDLRPADPTRPDSRNLISSLTINDQSPIMMATAESKFEEQQTKSVTPFRGTVDFVVGDAGIRGVIARPEGGYDTIIETMGLCSMVDPVGFLQVMGALCRQPGEQSQSTGLQSGEDDGKGGRILLLEHGRSSFEMLNKVLDSGASMHADHYGCWWNKDIGKIVQQSGLEIEKIRRYHFGTTWELHLRPISTGRHE